MKSIKFTPGIPRNVEPGPLQTGAKLGLWRFLNPRGLIGAYVGLVYYIYNTAILIPWQTNKTTLAVPQT